MCSPRNTRAPNIRPTIRTCMWRIRRIIGMKSPILCAKNEHFIGATQCEVSIRQSQHVRCVLIWILTGVLSFVCLGASSSKHTARKAILGVRQARTDDRLFAETPFRMLEVFVFTSKALCLLVLWHLNKLLIKWRNQFLIILPNTGTVAQLN